MTTLMTFGNSEGSRRCDAKCYDAIHSKCDCICGGMNHGAGMAKAASNTQEHGLDLIEKFKGQDARILLEEKLGLQTGLFAKEGLTA